MAGVLDDSEIEIPCENCGKKTKKKIGWIRSHSEYSCSCGTKIKLDTAQFKAEIAKIERALANLEHSFKNFGK